MLIYQEREMNRLKALLLFLIVLGHMVIILPRGLPDVFVPVSYLGHLHTRQCILEWSKVTNKCPQCKFRFHTIKAVKELRRNNDRCRVVYLPYAVESRTPPYVRSIVCARRTRVGHQDQYAQIARKPALCSSRAGTRHLTPLVAVAAVNCTLLVV